VSTRWRRWLTWLAEKPASSRHTSRPRKRAARLRLEVLESRDLPSAYLSPTYVLLRHGGATPLGTTGPTGTTPAQIRHAYGFDQITFNNGTVAGDGSGTTIAIVDAYDDPNIANDLHQFDLKFGLPDPVFTKVNQTGGSTPPPANGGWASEIALDVEWAHAIAPGANILLVEANNNSITNLYAAVRYAASQPGVVAVSMSWGGGEYSGETGADTTTFVTPGGHTGVTFVASSGDGGAPPIYPSASPNVLSVGGTHLSLDSSGNILSETGWSGSGGGLSVYESQPSYQNGVVMQSTTKRTTPDVAYDSDPNTGFPVYDSYNNGTTAPWSQFGGTSAAAPQWAALLAIADQGRALLHLDPLDGRSQTLPLLYGLSAVDYRDTTSGTSLGNPHYSAGVGYDLVTGLGTPRANRIVADLTGGPQQGGFEAPNVGTGTYGAFQYNPSGTAWTFSDGSGVAGNGSGFTAGNPNAPEGTQVAFLQGYGTASQTVTFAGGVYSVSFRAAQRGNGNFSSQTFQVLIDSNVVGTFTPAGTSYTAFTTSPFAVTPGSHTLTFVGTDPDGQDNTAFLDQVQLTLLAGALDPGFEKPSVGTGTYGAFQYQPSGSPWTFGAGAGVAGNGSGFTSGNPNAPDGTQVAFLQGFGSASQSVSFAAGTYSLSFRAAQRGNGNASSQTFQVLVDGTVRGTFTPTDTNYATFTTSSFTFSTAGAHTITFVGIDPDGLDNTAFIDSVRLNVAS
jgi:subtilase family serine protease